MNARLDKQTAHTAFFFFLRMEMLFLTDLCVTRNGGRVGDGGLVCCMKGAERRADRAGRKEYDMSWDLMLWTCQVD
jgi:hypothetical protein